MTISPDESPYPKNARITTGWCYVCICLSGHLPSSHVSTVEAILSGLSHYEDQANGLKAALTRQRSGFLELPQLSE